MTGEPVIRTESLGGSPLSRAARAGELPQWYRAMPHGADDWRQYARRLIAGVPSTWCDQLSDAIEPTGRAAQRLARSAGGAGLVTTTGQQPGLFGGPLMTLVKAVSARAIADALQETIGIPVAPVFWAATDDADFDEAAVVSVALAGGARELRLAQRAPAGTPMTRIAINDEIAALAPWLREACGSAPHESYLASAIAAFHDGATIGDAYVSLLRQILEPLEISVLDASHSSVSRAAAPLLLRAATHAQRVADAVRRRNDEIVAAGFTPQVVEVPGLSAVFLNADGTKRRLTLAEAAGIGELRGEQFLSSTVLLRPLMEQAILPTAMYVGGPGEVAYFAQISAVADALGLDAPLVAPRWSMTVLEPRVQKMLDGFGISADMLADPHAADTRLARERMAPDAIKSLLALRGDVATDVDRLRATNEGLVPAPVFAGLQRSLEHTIERLERRLIAGVKRREADAMRQLATCRGALYPHGARQERKLSYIPFLARYGPGLLEQMLGAARAHARTLIATTPNLVSSQPVSAPARA